MWMGLLRMSKDTVSGLFEERWGVSTAQRK